MTEYHEPYEAMPDSTRDEHRAIRSLQEELEAVDWYQQRMVVCADPELRRILEHNRDEEIEHACMLLEWLRRHTQEWEPRLRRYLFAQGDITSIEQALEGSAGSSEPAAPSAPSSAPRQGSLAIGSLKGK